MTLLADQGKAVASARSFSGLSYLLSPIDLTLFQDEYGESKPLLIQRDDPAYFHDLLTLDDVDRLLSTSGHQLSNVRVVVNGRERAVSELRAAAGVNSLESLYEHYRNGWTIVPNRLDDSSASLQRLSRELAAEVNARFQMNIYVTPAGNQGFKPHYDTHDVFVAQVHGSKRWRVASQPYPLPLADRQYDKSQPEPEPDLEFDLRHSRTEARCCGDDRPGAGWSFSCWDRSRPGHQRGRWRWAARASGPCWPRSSCGPTAYRRWRT